jgi:hypothetical protein
MGILIPEQAIGSIPGVKKKNKTVWLTHKYDIIKMDLKETDCEDANWFQLAQDKIQ